MKNIALFIFSIISFAVNAQPGSLDNTFGTGGKVTTDFGNGNDWGTSVAIQGDGKIVVAGTAYNNSNYEFALIRYNSDGGLDNTFGSGGKVTTDFGYNTVVLSVAIQSDGKIVVAGWGPIGSSNFILIRYNRK